MQPWYTHDSFASQMARCLHVSSPIAVSPDACAGQTASENESASCESPAAAFTTADCKKTFEADDQRLGVEYSNRKASNQRE